MGSGLILPIDGVGVGGDLHALRFPMGVMRRFVYVMVMMVMRMFDDSVLSESIRPRRGSMGFVELDARLIDGLLVVVVDWAIMNRF